MFLQGDKNDRVADAIMATAKRMEELGIKVPECTFRPVDATSFAGDAYANIMLIRLSTYIFTSPLRDLYSTIAHEILHLIAEKKEPGCGHRGEWRRLADYLNRHTDWNIQRLVQDGEHTELDDARKTFPYQFRCQCCGQMIYRKVRSKFVKEYERYRCKCGGKFEKIKG